MEAEAASPAERGGILLSVVEDVFDIRGRGCVIVPGAPYPSEHFPVLHRGDPVVLRRPDGSEVQSSIRELEMIRRSPPTPFTPILLPRQFTKADVPVGTEIWYFAPGNEHR